MRTLPLTLATLGLIAPAFAQEVTLRGKVEDVAGTQNSFLVGCTNTQLTSGAFNLNLFVGQSVELSGTWNGSSANPSVQVTAIQPVVETFEIGGGAKIGKSSTLGFTAAPGTVALGFLTTAPGFLPLPGSGVILIDPSAIAYSASGVVGGAGVLQIPFNIPNNPNLVGLEFFGQGALINGLNVLLTNPDCKTISD